MSVFNLPDLGEGLHDAEIVTWHVKPGDAVRSGDTLVSVETDKAVVDIPSPAGGTVVRTYGAPGEHLAVGAPLVEFAESGTTDAGALVGRLPTGDKAPGHAQQASPATAPIAGAQVKATPAVRAQARRLGVDIATVTPSSPDGHITAADVESAASGPPGAAAAEPLRGPRRAMARNMAHAHAEVAATTVTDEAIVDHWDATTDVTALLIKAIVAGCAASPALNAWFDGHGMTRVLHRHVDVGIAMDTEEGLFVPALRDAATHDVTALRTELDRLKAAVTARKVTPDELRGQTITLSNFGVIGGRHAALMILPPQVAILGAGGVAPRVVAIDGHPAVRRTLPLSLTFDHRAVTGGEAARFLNAVIDALERRE